MLPSTLSLTSRRGWLAAGAVICFLAFATPASAGPLCVVENSTADITGSACRNFAAGDDVARFFLFDAGSGFDHLLRITIDEVLVPFGLRIVRNLVTPGPIPGFPAYNCVPYGPAGMCVEYLTRDVVDPTLESHPDEAEYNGPIIWLASWLLPIGTDPIPEIFHDLGTDDGTYDEIMDGIAFSAELGPYDFTCDEPDQMEGINECEPIRLAAAKLGDPVRVALSDSFSAAQVGQLAAPEPATMALFALVGAGVAVRQRRRR